MAYCRYLPALVLSALLVPREAEACDPDICFNEDFWRSFEPVNAALIPTDGVLVLSGLHSGGGGVTKVDGITLAVTLEGAPVAGTLETAGVPDVLVWRPAAPLSAGATYQVTGLVDIPDDLDYCGDDIDLDFEFLVDAGPAVPLEPPSLSTMSSVAIVEEVGFDTLVCCDGTYPEIVILACGPYTDQFGWEPGLCGSKTGTGYLKVSLDIAPKLPISTTAMLGYRLIVDGEPQPGGTLKPALSLTSLVAVCLEVEVSNLATGEVLVSPAGCVDAEPGEQLGVQSLDPGLVITDCPGALQTCEVDAEGEAWDPAKCTPWPPEGETGTPTSSDGEGSEGSEGSDTAGENEGEKGCGCAGDPEPVAGLALVGLGLALRRRRRR